MVAHSSKFENIVFREEEQNELEIWFGHHTPSKLRVDFQTNMEKF